jgi:hypothetical protein
LKNKLPCNIKAPFAVGQGALDFIYNDRQKSAGITKMFREKQKCAKIRLICGMNSFIELTTKMVEDPRKLGETIIGK